MSEKVFLIKAFNKEVGFDAEHALNPDTEEKGAENGKWFNRRYRNHTTRLKRLTSSITSMAQTEMLR